MSADFVPTLPELLRFLPEILLSLTATLLMVLAPILKEDRNQVAGRLGIGGLLAALWATAVARSYPGPAFNQMLVSDDFAAFFRALVISVGALVALLSFDYLRREGARAAEYHALLLYSVAGQCIMAAATELIMVFIGLEISSIASYVLAGYLREDRRASESALKYFLLGSFATAFLLYGVAWIYGLTGSTNLAEIHGVLATREIAPPGVLAGASAALMFAGLAFKVSAAPFQVWTPDVYQGAPIPVAAFLSAGPKAAAFAVLLRVFMTAFEPVSASWESLAWITALATMTIGNFAALVQTNLKRLLAYSAIAHAGYLLVAVAAHSENGVAAVMFYLAAYSLMNIGAFTVLTYFARKGERYLEIRDLAGFSARRPAVAALFALFLLSLVGIPLTGGFFAKFYVFKAALEERLVWLTILGLLNSAVAAYYYLRILVVMYMHEPEEQAGELPPPAAGVMTVLWFTAAGTLILGIFPSAVLDFVSRAASLLH